MESTLRSVSRLTLDTKLTNLQREHFAFEWSKNHPKTPEIHAFPDAKHRDEFVEKFPMSVEDAIAESEHGRTPSPAGWRARKRADKRDVVKVFNAMTDNQKRTMVVVHTYGKV